MLKILPHTLFILLVYFGGTINVYGQKNYRNSQFVITGQIIGQDTGSVIFWHSDSANKTRRDTLKLNKGKFILYGTVNRVSEAYLWTDISNRIFGDSSVIQFLLEPDSIDISYKVHSGTNPIIKGSKSQTQKEEWDKQKSALLLARVQALKFYKQIQLDSIIQRIKAMDVRYIEQHPNSYLSAYLLFLHTHTPKLSVDSIITYYNRLPFEVKNSSVGHDVLAYIYPLTDDNEFRKANPLITEEFDNRLSRLKSVYELSFKDSSGNTIGLNSFKNNYLVVDFWASWCKPCIANVPALNKLVKEYKSDSIKFISVSLDKDANEWKQAIIEHNFKGIQLLEAGGFNSLAAIYCKALWVPTYILADNKGHIIYYNAPQAIDPELKKMINAVLKKID